MTFENNTLPETETIDKQDFNLRCLAEFTALR